MSFWVAFYYKVKIAKHYQEQVGYLFNGEYDKITNEDIKDFAEWYELGKDGGVPPIKKWMPGWYGSSEIGEG